VAAPATKPLVASPHVARSVVSAVKLKAHAAPSAGEEAAPAAAAAAK